MVSFPSSMPYVEATDESLETTFQSFKVVMQSYPPRVLDRRLQEAWIRATKEGPRVLMNLRVDF